MLPRMYDAIIVGARCAGAPAAMLLARSGYRVLAIDRSTFPSDIMSTHFIQPQGAARLERWGVLQRVLDAGTPPIERVTMHLGSDVAMESPAPPGLPPAICPRRTILDAILVDAAREAGAEVREGATLQDLLIDGDRVAGIRARARDGVIFEEHARVVIGADGMHSAVARIVRAPEYDTHPAMTCGYYAYWAGVDPQGAHLCLNNRTGMLAFPTNDGLTCIALMRPIDDFDAFRRDIDATYRRHVTACLRLIGSQLPAATIEGRYIGTADTRNYFRRPYGPGWALVGDAGYHRDPVTGLGISDAFRDVEFLVEALDAALSGREPADEALAAYERRRNEAARPDYDRTLFFASLPSKEQVLAAMASQPA